MSVVLEPRCFNFLPELWKMPPLFPGGSRWWMSGTSPILVPRRVGNCSRSIKCSSSFINGHLRNLIWRYLTYHIWYIHIYIYIEGRCKVSWAWICHLFQPEHLFRYRSWWRNGVSQARPTPKLCSNSWVCARQGSARRMCGRAQGRGCIIGGGSTRNHPKLNHMGLSENGVHSQL